jgi:hypothetical protein
MIDRQAERSERLAYIREIADVVTQKFESKKDRVDVKAIDVPEGTFESTLSIVRETFGEELRQIEDFNFWEEIDERTTMKPKEACFQYYLHGISHEDLSDAMLKHFEPIRTGLNFGRISPEQYKILLSRLSSSVLEQYPPRYRAKHAKKTA